MTTQTEPETSPPETTGPETATTQPDETKREIPQGKRDELAKTDKARDDGSYPIENVGDLKNAISAYGRAKEEDREKLRAHIVRNAKRLHAENMLPGNWSETPAGAKKEKKAIDPFTAGVLLALASYEDNELPEYKAGPPGATFPSKDPGAAKLRKYWTKGPGAAKIAWGTDGDFNRCVTNLTKHVGERAKGLCNIYHRTAVGGPPGKGHKSEEDTRETKALWVPDADVSGGWRANEAAWELETKETDVAARAPDTRSDDEVLSGLDKHVEQAETVEEAYEAAIVADIPWQLEPNGDLTDAGGGTDGDAAATLFGDAGAGT